MTTKACRKGMRTFVLCLLLLCFLAGCPKSIKMTEGEVVSIEIVKEPDGAFARLQKIIKMDTGHVFVMETYEGDTFAVGKRGVVWEHCSGRLYFEEVTAVKVIQK